MIKLLITFITGGALGLFTMALMSAAGKDDERNGRK